MLSAGSQRYDQLLLRTGERSELIGAASGVVGANGAVLDRDDFVSRPPRTPRPSWTSCGPCCWDSRSWRCSSPAS
ncbi:MAG: hypothetical protein R2716_08830 [Microthrixaceae bacterium]